MNKMIFHGVVNRKPTEIYKTENGNYYAIVKFPYTENNIKHLQNLISTASEKERKLAKIVVKEENEKKNLYFKYSIKFLDMARFMFENRNKNELKNNNQNINGNRKTQVKKPTKNTLRSVVFLSLMLLTLSGFAIFNSIGLDSNNNLSPQETSIVNATSEPNNTASPIKQHIDYDDLDYRTWQNSGGNTLIELADALVISDVCYQNIIEELEAYNNSVPENQRYSFDPSKFTPEMFIGEQIRESSLILTKNDINDECRGPFKIGSLAAIEANKVSMNLAGENILVTDEDFYDPVKACRACMYIAIKNYEYCQGVTNYVKPEMVFDTYLYGCGNVRTWLREGTYEQQIYSKYILTYTDSLKKYYDELKSGKTDGSHDKYWNDCYRDLYSVSSSTFSKEPEKQ